MNKDSITKYFKRFIDIVPTQLETYDTSRVIILQFALSGLDIIGTLNVIDENNKMTIIEWLYSLQLQTGGFHGGFFPNNSKNYQYMSCHVTMTYSALVCLSILGDDLSKVDKNGIIESFRKLQSIDGCFRASLDCPESDVRFIFSAVASCSIIGDFSGIDIESVVRFIDKCQDCSGGFGQRPNEEGHGGSTYCAIASLYLLDRLNSVLTPSRRYKLIRWLMWRQKEGFHGRPHKDDDSCYTFWIGATLTMLGHSDLIDINSLVGFHENTYDHMTGGFNKLKGSVGSADPLHTYMSLAGLSSILCDSQNNNAKSKLNIESLNPETTNLINNLNSLNPSLNLTTHVTNNIKLRQLTTKHF